MNRDHTFTVHCFNRIFDQILEHEGEALSSGDDHWQMIQPLCLNLNARW